MRVVDTSAWIEWLTGSVLGQALAAELPDRRQWLVPTMVQLELAKWLVFSRCFAKRDTFGFPESLVRGTFILKILAGGASAWAVISQPRANQMMSRF